MQVQVLSKAKIGKDQFYCCKLKDLQDRLAGIDCDFPVTVSFDNAKCTKEKTIRCLQLIYWRRAFPASQQSRESSLSANNWYISVNAIDRRTSELAKTALQDGGWDTITDWIAAKVRLGLPMERSELRIESDGQSIRFVS